MNYWKFLMVSCFLVGSLLTIFKWEGYAETTSRPVRISVTYQGNYESAWAAGSFDAFSSGKMISISFEWQTFKVYSGNKEIKKDRAYLDTYLRERLTKGQRINLSGKWHQKYFEADKIYLPAETR
jgi:hypothetical protein